LTGTGDVGQAAHPQESRQSWPYQEPGHRLWPFFRPISAQGSHGMAASGANTDHEPAHVDWIGAIPAWSSSHLMMPLLRLQGASVPEI